MVCASDREKKQQYRLSVLNSAINNVFHLFYRSAKMTPPVTISPLLLHSVQITSVLSLHSFIFLSWSQMLSCCSSSCNFIKEAGRQCQQAAPSHLLVLCHVAERLLTQEILSLLKQSLTIKICEVDTDKISSPIC